MPEYDFRSLSSHDFEQIVRDLLQEELEVTLESFKAGRDDGIDLRYSTENERDLIIQCKHYVESGFQSLVRTLRNNELPKVKKLNPSKYIIATSVALNPRMKRVILKIFRPFCKSTGSIYGKDDLNNLLGKFKDIERRNYKLWLTSSAVMDQILHSEVYSRSDIELEEIKKKMKFYVQNESYFEALKFLEENHFCIIAGIPGIGKSTLAEILSIEYLSNGYEIIKISQNIREAYEVYNKEKKQLFYYDDFLGQTSLDLKLHKNEEQDLINFFESIKNSPNSRFILTTREYILNQAKQTYEKISTFNFDIFKYVIELETYTKKDKAKILFNHLYFSDLPKSFLNQIIQNEKYLTIINHKNYSPRIIESMTDISRLTDIPEEKYPDFFIDNLNNPFRLWDHAFNYQISDSSKNLLIILSTFSSETDLDKLRSAFSIYQLGLAKEFNIQISRRDFDNSLKELEGNFISVKHQNQISIQFHNPSIRDYLEFVIANNIDLIPLLITCSVNFEQLMKIWQFAKTNEKIFDEVKKNQEIYITLLLKMAKINFSKSTWFSNYESNCITVLNIILELNKHKINDLINSLLPLSLERLNNGKTNKDDLVLFLINLKKGVKYNYKKFPVGYLQKVKDFLVEDTNFVNDFNSLIKFLNSFSRYSSDKDYFSLRTVFLEVVNFEVEYYLNEYDPEYDMEIDEFIYELNNISKYLGLNVDEEIQKVESYAQDMDLNLDSDLEYDRWKEDQIFETLLENEIESMFQGLISN